MVLIPFHCSLSENLTVNDSFDECVMLCHVVSDGFFFFPLKLENAEP